MFMIDCMATSGIFRIFLGAANGITVAGESTGIAGSFSYQLNSPTAVLLDPFNNIYILDMGNSRIQRWSAGANSGTTVVATTMGSPQGMRFDLSRNIVMADTNYHRVQRFPVWCRTFNSTHLG